MADIAVANNALSSLPFHSLIGGPLVAAVRAQSLAARETASFIQNVGFETTVDDKSKVTSRKARMVTFSYTKVTPANTGDNKEEVTLSVPLLTILPIPYLRIDDMSIHFKANITASAEDNSESSSSETANVTSKTNAGWWFVKTELTASYSSKKDSKTSSNSKYAVEYTMDVSVHAVQDDMPKGMATLLCILNDNAIDKGSKPASTTTPPAKEPVT